MKLYICDMKNSDIGDRFDEHLNSLATEKKEYILKARQKKGQMLRLARELLFEAVCRDNFDGTIPDITKNDHGKPMFLAPYDGYYFNISHSGDLVIMGISDELIGVDVERIGRTNNFKGIMRYFTEDERAYINENIDMEEERFYRVWTYREAFSKLMGEGLLFFDKNKADISFDSKTVIFDKAKYLFYEYRLNDYLIVLCMDEKKSVKNIMRFDGSGFVKMNDL